MAVNPARGAPAPPAVGDDPDVITQGSVKKPTIAAPTSPGTLTPRGEGLLASTTLRLFGRPYDGLSLGDLGDNTTSNNPLIKALNASAPARLARIYGFSYLGNYYKLPEPIVFLVFSEGTLVKTGFESTTTTIGAVGIEQRIFGFDENVYVWTADELDITVRVDVSIGWLRELLVAQAAIPENNISGGVGASPSNPQGMGQGGDPIQRGMSAIGRGMSALARGMSAIGR